MLKGIFNPDNVVFRFINKVGCIWLLNILWLVCSLPIFTIGASTTALIYSCMKLRHDDGYTYKNFFKSFKDNFKQATILWLIYLLGGGIIAVGLVFWNQSTLPFAKIAWAVVLAIAIAYCISFLYVFAIQSKFYNPIKDTIKYSVWMAFLNIFETLLMLLIVGAVAYLNLTKTFIVNFVTLNIGVGLVVYWLAPHYEKVFNKYIPDDMKVDYSYDPDYVDLDIKDVDGEINAKKDRIVGRSKGEEADESAQKTQ